MTELLGDAFIDFVFCYIGFLFGKDKWWLRRFLNIVLLYVESVSLWTTYNVLIHADFKDQLFHLSSFFIHQTPLNILLAICLTSHETFLRRHEFIKNGLKRLPKSGKNAQIKITKRRQNMMRGLFFVYSVAITAYVLAFSTHPPRRFPLWLQIHTEMTGLSYVVLHLWTIACSYVLLYVLMIPLAAEMLFYHYVHTGLDVYVDHFVTQVTNEFNQEIIYRSLKEFTDGLAYFQRETEYFSRIVMGWWYSVLNAMQGFSNMILWFFLISGPEDDIFVGVTVLDVSVIVIMILYGIECTKDRWRQLRYTLYECSWIEWNKKNRNALRLNLIYLTRELALYEFCNKAMDLDLIIQISKIYWGLITLFYRKKH